MFPGVRNTPAHLPAICTVLAQLMNVSAEQLAAASTANCCEVFGW
jgi:TatD DNase family protein